MSARMLVVDDEPRMARLVQLILEEAGYEVRVCPDGESCLETLRAWHPDLIILDLMMPGLSGIEVLEQLRADPSLAHLPVLLYSASGPLLPSAGEARRLRVGVLRKPFDLDSLLTAVHSLLGQPWGAEGASPNRVAQIPP